VNVSIFICTMVSLKGNLSFLVLLLSGKCTESARISTESVEHDVDTTQWGRSCSSLETRFLNQQSRLAESEGNAALIRSISLMRTLRRANARDCEWATQGRVDTSVAAEMASRHFQQTPCYEPARDAFNAAQTLPEEEREPAMEVAVTILLSDEEGCAPLLVDAPDLNEADEELEGEVDDATDELTEELATSSGSSLMQQEQNPLLTVPWVGAVSWISMFVGGWPFVIAAILVGILMGMLCNTVVHMIIRIFRWIRCKAFGSSCSEYSPAGWARVLIAGGCGAAGLFGGGFGTLFGITLLPGSAEAAAMGVIEAGWRTGVAR